MILSMVSAAPEVCSVASTRCPVSAAVIAMTFFLQPQLVGIGVLFLGFSAILAVIRVVTGIHFISDVLGAFVFAAAAWSIGFYLF